MNQRSASVAVIGLGAIGLPVAINLSRSGALTQVWNRSKPAIETATAAGAHFVSELHDIDAPIILTVLPDIAQVYEVLDNGLRAALKPGDILVVMGTVSPVAVVELGKELVAQQIDVLDAPVSGGDVGAQKGELSIMVGGNQHALEIVRPIFEIIGSTIRHLGPLGSGELAKACNQIVVAVTLTALAEAVTLARKAGLDTKTVLDILAGGLAGSQVLNVKREKIESMNFAPGGSAVFQLKDLRFALEAGKSLGVSLPVTEEVTALFEALIASGDGALDHSAIIREIERRSN
ncbi:MAG: NAD(P)-dependent oxidoreductase [Actinomycetes bacterium]